MKVTGLAAVLLCATPAVFARPIGNEATPSIPSSSFSYDEFLDNYNLSEMPSEVCEPTTYDIVALPPPGPIFPANATEAAEWRSTHVCDDSFLSERVTTDMPYIEPLHVVATSHPKTQKYTNPKIIDELRPFPCLKNGVMTVNGGTFTAHYKAWMQLQHCVSFTWGVKYTCRDLRPEQIDAYRAGCAAGDDSKWAPVCPFPEWLLRDE